MHKRGFYSGKRGDGHHGGPKKYRHSPWFQEMTGRKGTKIERGEIKYLILDALNEQERHGYDIMQSIEEKSGGLYRPSPGALYPALQMLEDLGMVFSSAQGKRKIYQLTPKGLDEINSKADMLEDIYGDMELIQHSEWENFFEKAHEELSPMFRAVSRSFRRDGLQADKTKKILETIRQTAAKVTKILNG